MTSSVSGTPCFSPSACASVLPSAAVAAIASTRPAWASIVSADRLSASEIALSTRTDGWCRPRAPPAALPTGPSQRTSYAKYSTRQRRVVGTAACCPARWAERVPACVRRGGGSLGVFGTRHQRGGRLEDLFCELALAGEQLLGEVVGAGHEFLRLGQLVGARNLHRGDLGGDGLDGLDPGLDRVDDGLLALADGVQNLVLQVLRGVACHFPASL